MESMVAIISCLVIPLILTGFGSLTGWVFGKISTRVLRELDPNVSTQITSQIQKRTLWGFLIGGLIGSIPVIMSVWKGLDSRVYTLEVWRYPLYISFGFALMGSIGAAIAGSELFREE